MELGIVDESEIEDADVGWEDVEVQGPEGGNAAKRQKERNVIQKVQTDSNSPTTLPFDLDHQQLHDTVVFVLRSEVRRARMRRLIRQVCDKQYKHLSLIKSMPICWNTTFAEITRAVLLRPVCRCYIFIHSLGSPSLTNHQ